jgi:hypothetical protein
MLCALGPVVFSAAATPRRRDGAVMALAFVVAAVIFTPDVAPDAALLGALAALGALLTVLRPRFAILGAALGGVLAACAATLLELQRVPAAIAVTSGALLIVVPMWLARTRPAFAPAAIRDEALLTIAVLGGGVAILPGVLDGWQAATNLAAASDRATAAAVPIWTIALLSSSAFLGAVYSFWSRR